METTAITIIRTTTTTETEGITTTTTTTNTASEAATMAAVAAVGDILEEVGMVITQTVTDTGKVARPPRVVTAETTGMDTTRVWHAATVPTDTGQMPPLQTCKVDHRQDAPGMEGAME